MTPTVMSWLPAEPSAAIAAATRAVTSSARHGSGDAQLVSHRRDARDLQDEPLVPVPLCVACDVSAEGRGAGVDVNVDVDVDVAKIDSAVRAQSVEDGGPRVGIGAAAGAHQMNVELVRDELDPRASRAVRSASWRWSGDPTVPRMIA